MTRQGDLIELKESRVYKQHRIPTLQLPSGLWLVSIVNSGRREIPTRDSLTSKVTRIPREHDSEERAIQAAKDYIDQQMVHEEET
jgi:hypothetical protein